MMNRILRSVVLIAILMLSCDMLAQSARDLVRLGNAAYRDKQYDKAETLYLKSAEKVPSFEAYYNMGNTMVMQQKDSTAFVYYQMADSIGTDDPVRRAKNFHNMGNIWYAQGLEAMKRGGNAGQAFQNAVNLYKSSLRCNPNDNETRYNLAMAQFMLKKNQNNDDNNQNKNDQNEDKKDLDKQQQNQDKQNENKDKHDKKDEQQQQKDEMNDQVAEQLLNSAQQDEKSVQQKVKQQQNGKRKTLEKDW